MTQNYFFSAAETAAILPDIAALRGCAPFHAGGEPGWIVDEETYAQISGRLSANGIDPRRFEDSGVYGLVRVRLPAPTGTPDGVLTLASGTTAEKPKRKRKAPAAPAGPAPQVPTFESESVEARVRLAAAMGVASVSVQDGKGQRRKPAATETAVVWMNSGIPSPNWHRSVDSTRVYFDSAGSNPYRDVLNSVGHGRIVHIPNVCSNTFIEIVGNEIFLGIPLSAKDARERAFFNRVLDAVSKAFEDDAALRAGREASFDAARASVVPLLSGIQKRRTAELDRTLSNRQQSLASLVREKSLLSQQAAALSASLEAMERVAAVRKEALKSSFAEMAADPKVVAVWGRSNILHVKTVPLACEDSATGRIFDIGSWTLGVEMGSGSIQWEGDGPMVEGIRHPKISRDGYADFGPLAEAFADFFAQGDLARHIGIAISFLENVDSTDPLGLKILAWPEIRPAAPASVPDEAAIDGAAGEETDGADADGGETGTAEESVEAAAPSEEAADGSATSRMRAKLKNRIRGGADGSNEAAA